MFKFKVVVTDYVFPNLDPEREILARAGARLVSGQCKTRDEVIELARGADALLNTYYGPVDGAVMDAMPNCRIIVRYGIGVDTIDIPAATARGIMVANVPDYCIDEVSDHGVAMFLALARKLPQGNADVNAGNNGLAGLKPMKRISSMTVGVVGMGRIGRAIVDKLAPFGCEVVFFDPYFQGPSKFIVRHVGLNELFAECDAIILQAPANAETYHLLNAEAFAMMAKQPVIVNCARGELIDTAALVLALDRGQVSGAALDVVEELPATGNARALLNRRNVILTPHSAWFSAQALHSLQRLAAMEVARALTGEAPKSLQNPEVRSRVAGGAEGA